MIDRARSAAVLLAGSLALSPLAVPVSFAQACVADYERALALLKQNAGECAKNNKLMTALADAAAAPSHPGWTGINTGSFRRDSAHDFVVYAPKRPDHRWRMEGDNLVFNCTVPLSPNAMPQNEAFLECARVYACGAATASCGIATARQTGSRDCKGITEQCMASHPIPQGTMGPVLAAPLPQQPAPVPPPAQRVPGTATSAVVQQPTPAGLGIDGTWNVVVNARAFFSTGSNSGTALIRLDGQKYTFQQSVVGANYAFFLVHTEQNRIAAQTPFGFVACTVTSTTRLDCVYDGGLQKGTMTYTR